jgi:hypothetical protein
MDPTLTGANVTFHTNDEDKDYNTFVSVVVHLRDGRMEVAKLLLEWGTFNDHTDAGPFDMVVVTSVTREQLKTGNVTISILPKGNDTWRFNFLLDMLFSDGAHLIARANGIELTQDSPSQSFGIE